MNTVLKKFLAINSVVIGLCILVLGYQWRHTQNSITQNRNQIQNPTNNKTSVKHDQIKNFEFELTEQQNIGNILESQQIPFAKKEIQEKLESLNSEPQNFIQSFVQKDGHLAILSYNSFNSTKIIKIETRRITAKPASNYISQDIGMQNSSWLIIVSLCILGLLFVNIIFMEKHRKRLQQINRHLVKYSEGDFKYRTPVNSRDEISTANLLLNNFGKNLEIYIEKIIKTNRTKKSQEKIKNHINKARLNERRYLNDFLLNPSINSKDFSSWSLKWIDDMNYIFCFFQPVSQKSSHCNTVIEISNYFDKLIEKEFADIETIKEEDIARCLQSTFLHHEETILDALHGLTIMHFDFENEQIKHLNSQSPLFAGESDSMNIIKDSNSRHDFFNNTATFKSISMNSVDKIVITTSTLMNKSKATLTHKKMSNFIKDISTKQEKRSKSVSFIEINKQIDDIELRLQVVA